jgi:hypothetical protein
MYKNVERLIAERIAAASQKPLFKVGSDGLWELYRDNLPQEFNCNTCKEFIRKYGDLVNADGRSVLWYPGEGLGIFAGVFSLLKGVVEARPINSIYLSSDRTWGVPQNKWSHLHGYNQSPFIGDAHQAMALKKEEHGMLIRGMDEFPAQIREQAATLLKADVLNRSNKTLAIAEWFRDIKNPWLAVATAPPGYCHIKSTMIGTLLEDLKAGLPMAVVKDRWDKKMHPLKYMRPTAAPTDGAIDAAEKLVDKLEVRKSFERRFASLADVTKLWQAGTLERFYAKTDGGIFDSLRAKPEPLVKGDITWAKFSRDILPSTKDLKVLVPATGAFIGVVTAVHPESPVLFQWGTHVSWYFYHGGSIASRWGQKPGWTQVTAVLPDSGLAHQSRYVVFTLPDCYDRNSDGLALFPETFKSEYHGIRKVVEAFSRKGRVQGTGDASGLAFQEGNPVRVRADGIEYRIDRWE